MQENKINIFFILLNLRKKKLIERLFLFCHFFGNFFPEKWFYLNHINPLMNN